jgi:hypothetical protein
MFFILSMLIPKGNNIEKVHNTCVTKKEGAPRTPYRHPADLS